MVICKFFQQGTCRFGTKCTNEHFDVKQLIRGDAESAVNGKQWPFSCFGPFKDKGSLPNFIEDQSFEEIRYLCYESKKKNQFEQFHQQFTTEANEATNKMKAMLNMAPELYEMIVKVYDGELVAATGGGLAGNSNNPFASSGHGSALGIKRTETSMQGSIFGGGVGDGFGNSMATTNMGRIFGGGAANTVGGSIFGQQTTQPATSLFGGGGNQTSIFGQQQQPQQQQATGIFGQAAQQNTTTASGVGLFAQATQQMNVANAGGGIFGKASGQQQMPPTGLFAQAAAQQTSPPPPFGQASVFGQQQQPQQPSGGCGIFGQQMQAMPAQATTGIFGQTQQQITSPPPSGLFASAAVQAGPPPSGFFQQAMQQTGPMQQQQQQQQTQYAQASVYRRKEDLTEAEMEAFRAETFSEANLPLQPPPRELIDRRFT